MRILLGCLAAAGLLGATPALALDPLSVLKAPLSVIKGSVEAVVEDRSTGDIAKDARIKAIILVDVVEEMTTDVISISADVYEQNVMLTGSVETHEQRAKAEQLTLAINGVRKVYNEILVQKDVDKEKGMVENAVDDTIIETKIEALFLDARGVYSTNLRWRSVGGRVFLFGRALSQGEHDKAVRIAHGSRT